MMERLSLSLCFPDKETKVLKGLSQNSFQGPSQPQGPGLCDSGAEAQSLHGASGSHVNTSPSLGTPAKPVLAVSGPT